LFNLSFIDVASLRVKEAISPLSARSSSYLRERDAEASPHYKFFTNIEA